MPKVYVCSTGCNQNFANFTELKNHEITHTMKGYFCTWPECGFVTKKKCSYDIHTARHSGEKHYICPQDDCDYKTHDPSQLTRHRKKQHGVAASGTTPAPWHIVPIPTTTYSIPASPTYPQPIVGSFIRLSRYRGPVYHVYRTREGPKWVD
ncbi:hypothetical protein DFJ58DRAFT_914417 [Suillus subalutaceus]|uniref:uncharacterized protein n=1 Tax=Suillus subalutaceus TaxID=48586 RepID=UPI001B86C66A|nr:uncharacterized protein DFJ58DRAFT_914417 [Suillus subalutaceus]KAG1852285.1 hypothetical protein DFJ58DRAFT_914417 [Suillus subalutaceus]